MTYENEENSKKEMKSVQAVERALHILEVLGKANVPLSLSNLSTKVKLNITTVYRLLSTLKANGFVMQDPVTSYYKLGIKLFEIGNTALYELDIRPTVRPFLKEIVERFNETSNLAILDKGEVVYIDQVESTNIVKMFARIGSRSYCYCMGAGKVLMAFQNEADIDAILKQCPFKPFTSKTITSAEALKKELEIVRVQGYAFDMEEREEGVRCVAVPLRNFEGKVIAAISISGPSTRISLDYLQNELVPALKEIAMRASAKLGFH